MRRFVFSQKICLTTDYDSLLAVLFICISQKNSTSNFAIHLNLLDLTYLQIIQQPVGLGLGTMAGAERHKASKKKTKMRGSARYLHLLNFIARRREKKLEKRRTLDPSAKVILVIKRMLFLLLLLLMMMIMMM